MPRAPLDLSFTTQDHIVRAGAGAGKTFNLVECVVSAYDHFRKNGKTPRFVLTTFTRKATQELRERMVLKACELEDEEFFTFVTDPGRLTISTIHGILGQFLREFGHLHEMDLSFKILEGEDERVLMENAARELLTASPENLQWLEDFSFQRLLTMLKSFHAHFGKNDGLTSPSVDEIWNHTLAFVEAKKSVVMEVLEQGLAEVTDEPYLKALGEIREFLSLWDVEVELELPSLPRKTKRESFPVDFHEQIGGELKRFKAAMEEILLSKSELAALSERWTAFEIFARAYSQAIERHKIQGGFVTLGDLENQAFQVLAKAPFLGKIFSENFDFWLIDEFQDTSSHQLSVLNQLIGERPRFVVGDPQQSIYLFRGAEAGIFSREWERISGDGGRTSRLEVNYRSQKNLLEFLNHMMTGAGSFSAMEAFRPQETSPTVARLIEGEDLDDELRGIYLRVRELNAQGEKWDQICVLGRTHDDLFKVASFLKSKGVPTHVHSPLGYEERREVQDALSLYKFLINPHDDLNLLQVLRAPWLKVEDGVLARWMGESELSLWSYLESFSEAPHESVQTLRKFSRRLEELGLLRTFTELLTQTKMIEKSASFDPSGRVEANLWKLMDRMKDLERRPGSHPLDILFSLSQEADAVAAMEPNCVNLMTIHGSKGLEFDHVFFPRLGRRFQMSKRGFIAFSRDSGRFVFSLKDEDDRALVSSMEREWIDGQKQRERDEVARWFYVALTRAKKTLTLSWNVKERTSDSWVEMFSLKEDRFPFVERALGPFPEGERVDDGSGNLSPRAPYKSPSEIGETLKRASFSQISSEESSAWNYQGLKNKFSAQAKGIYWHRLFESMRFGDLEEGLSDFPFLSSLSSPPFKEILKDGHVEWGFQSLVGERILEGQIDLWGFDRAQNLWVLDYKTGSSKEPEKAIQQVKFYLWVLKRKGLQAKSLRWAVLYPLQEKVIEGEATPEDFEKLELELGLAERAGQ
jgi:ATP-dependent helicase/nuclease subunit A